ncbi:hypothetical protein [Kitasatospora brasiliensis]|uniref:hypothetical protein n=1 Tax=Kitasatospora brasiliensis TaxID=3058040 RepID=UPI00292D9A24|nr:hypothetical protein [Kitasatospora sp. K002]
MPTSNAPLTPKPHEHTESQANAVLVSPAGETTPVHLPTDPVARHAAASQHLGGEADYIGHTATCPHGTPVLSTAVTKDGDTLPVNLPATLALDLLRDEPSLLTLTGPVLFLGPPGADGQFTSLTDKQVQGLEGLLAVVRSDLRTPVGP